MAAHCTIEDFKEWLRRDLSRFCDTEDGVLLCKGGENYGDNESSKETQVFKIFTDNNVYQIVASETRAGSDAVQHSEWPVVKSYLGCQGSSRKPRAGEDWSRGNDLADGPLTEATWREILADIVSYEMVRVQHHVTGIRLMGRKRLRAAQGVSSALIKGEPSPRAIMPQEGHASDCAVHNMPAEPAGECDCGYVPTAAN